jgi:uncharacterized membrane protein YccF (DUF307 family)
MAAMRVLGNVLWFVFGGVFIGLGHILGGVGLCLTVVGIPFGLQAFKLGIASFAPFGKEVVERERANSALRVLFNVVWILLFGWEIAVAHVVLGLLLALTLVGIPFALQHLKLVPLALLPFGRELRPVES